MAKEEKDLTKDEKKEATEKKFLAEAVEAKNKEINQLKDRIAQLEAKIDSQNAKNNETNQTVIQKGNKISELENVIKQKDDEIDRMRKYIERRENELTDSLELLNSVVVSVENTIRLASRCRDSKITDVQQ